MQPKCSLFKTCGGCTSQHIPYDDQLQQKKELIQRLLSYDAIQVFSDQPYGYRNRMDFIFHKNGLGFRRKKKWYSIVDVKTCPISNEKINNLLEEVRDYFKGVDTFDVQQKIGTFRYAVIRTPRYSSSISFVLNDDSQRKEEAVQRIKEYSRTTAAENIVVSYVPAKEDMSSSSNYEVVKGTDQLEEQFIEKKFHFSIQGFFQNNTGMAEKMQEYVYRVLQSYNTAKAHLLDLYGGVGTFGIINAALFKSVTIVESVQVSIAIAKKNVQQNNVKNASCVCKDAKSLNSVALSAPLLVITDPPRSGMHQKTIATLNQLEPQVIIYVSCNPDQLSKDILKFKNYSIKSAALFDLFPQTHHCEVVIELVRIVHPE